jgi:hypothetical protein
MSGDPEFDKKFADLPKLSIWPRLLVSKPDAGYLQSIRSADLRQKLEDEEVEKEIDANYQALFPEFLGIQGEMHLKSSSYLAPFLKLTEYQVKARTTPLSQLRSLIEVAEVEMELVDEAISMLGGGISESLKNQMLTHNEVSVNYRLGGMSWGKHLYGEIEWNRHEQETLEKIQILDVAKLWYCKLIAIFQAAIVDRETRKPEIQRRIHAAAKLCLEAEKVIVKIREADATVALSYFKDLKAMRAFVLSWQRLDKLRAEFYTLGGSGIEFQDFGSPEPIFPSTAGLIAMEGDADRKRKIFQIFEKERGA